MQSVDETINILEHINNWLNRDAIFEVKNTGRGADSVLGKLSFRNLSDIQVRFHKCMYINVYI